MSVENLGKGGGKSKGIGDVFQGSGAGDTTFWGGDVGDDPSRGPGPVGVPTQGILIDHYEASLEVIGWDMGVSTSGDSNVGGGV